MRKVKEDHLLDIIEPDYGVDISIRPDGKVVWVNVDGLCVLRICRIPRLDVDDGRKKD